MREYSYMAWVHEKRLMTTDFERTSLGKFIRNDKNYLITFKELGKDMSVNQKLYYKKYIIPRIQQLFYKQGEFYTSDKIDEILRGEFSISTDTAYQSFEDMSMQETSLYLDWLNIYVAENFSTPLQSIKVKT